MAEEKHSTQKSRVESLSDLIFGLALSIGALTLIGNSPSSFGTLVQSIGYYAFSFLILISVWYSYTHTMSDLKIERRVDVELNILLLFLVSIEPFLFNELNSKNLPTEYVSILYALDLGGLFVIQALFANSILSDKSKPPHVLNHYFAVRNALFVGAAIFFISTLPWFWTWMIPIGNGIPLRLIIWIAPLFVRVTRRIWEEKQ